LLADKLVIHDGLAYDPVVYTPLVTVAAFPLTLVALITPSTSTLRPLPILTNPLTDCDAIGLIRLATDASVVLLLVGPAGSTTYSIVSVANDVVDGSWVIFTVMFIIL
jgi:hypothetical protein